MTAAELDRIRLRSRARQPTFPLQEIAMQPPSDPPPAIVTDFVRDAIMPQRIKRTVVAALMALGLAIGWCVAFAMSCGTQTGCASPQHPAPYTVREVVTIAHRYAKATCVAIEDPVAMSLATLTVPGYGPMAVGVARLACRLFIDDPRAESVAVAVMTDGHVEPVE